MAIRGMCNALGGVNAIKGVRFCRLSNESFLL